MTKVVISGTGLYTPSEIITNEELVASFNQYVHDYNFRHVRTIEKGERKALLPSSAEFILKASGIKSRHVIDKKNILDNNIMMPQIAARPDDALSFQAEFALSAAKDALKNAHKNPEDIDAVIVSCANMQRPYPGIAVELQQALGINKGYAFDMRVACSSATFGLQTAMQAILARSAKTVLLVTPEVATPQLDFRDRDSHFIFGDAATAVVLETVDTCKNPHPYEILSTKTVTQFSNNIRSNEGFMNRVERRTDETVPDKLFTQQGRAVFKEVIPMVVKIITEHLAENQLTSQDLKRLWLHQANSNMNQLIIEKLLGREALEKEAPIILDRFANTGSAGAIIAFHLYHDDLPTDALGILCSFGAGYSVGNIILKRI